MTGPLQSWARSASRDDLVSELLRMDAELASGLLDSVVALIRWKATFARGQGWDAYDYAMEIADDVEDMKKQREAAR